MIKSGDYNFDPQEFDEVSDEAKDLIQHMIAPLNKRYNSE